jgi:hypothetical protein
MVERRLMRDHGWPEVVLWVENAVRAWYGPWIPAATPDE